MQQSLARPQQRPLGVTIIAIILAIHGILDVILGITIIAGTLALGHVATAKGHTTTGKVVDTIGVTIGVVTLIDGLIRLICPVGLFLLKRWAYWLTLIIELFALAKGAFEFIHPQDHPVLIALPMILAAVIILYMLLDPNVRAAFFNRS